ncbi:MAG: protein-disulfide isomerase [Rickettsiales bacterium]|jgi:protein-disulfide isomerase
MNKNTKKISLIILVIVFVFAIAFLAKNNLFDKSNIEVSANNAPEVQNSTNIKDLLIENEASKILQISDNDIFLGDKNAPVSIIEYASLSCPHCATFYQDGFDKLNSQYIKTGKVKFLYRDFPLNQPALSAAVLALCQVENKDADAQKYHDFIKLLFKTQESWAFTEDFSEKLKTIAKLNGMSEEKFDNCINNKSLQEKILKSRLQAAQNLKIASTPTFFINSEMVSGYHGFGDIKTIIEKKLSEISASEKTK